jgi:hypothetical protein
MSQSANRDRLATVACPHCERGVTVPVPDADLEPTPSASVAAFGDHSVAHCADEHKFWVYYC